MPQECPKSAPKCSKGASKVFEKSPKSAIQVPQKYLKIASKGSQKFPSNAPQKCSKSVIKVPKACPKSASKVFESPVELIMERHIGPYNKYFKLKYKKTQCKFSFFNME